MKVLTLITAVSLTAGILGFSAAPQPKPSNSPELESVLRKLDAVAANFRTAQADFEWDYYPEGDRRGR